jgi:hypothetical protein
MICAEARAAIVNAQVGEAGDFSPFRTRLAGEQSAPRWLSSVMHTARQGR